jgi:hypothetical protein
LGYCSNTPPRLNGTFGELSWGCDFGSSIPPSFGKSVLSFGYDFGSCSNTPSSCIGAAGPVGEDGGGFGGVSSIWVSRRSQFT